MKRLLIPAVLLALAACDPAQLATVQTDTTQVATAVSQACGAVNAAAALAAPFSVVPQVGAILMFANASCSGATAVSGMVAKAAADPSTIAWLNKLAGDIKAVVPKV